jgi:hypothetical protein
MVNVVITENVRSRIISAVNKEFGPLLDRHKLSAPDVGEDIYDKMFGHISNGMLALPVYCFPYTDTLNIKTGGRTYEFKLPQKLPVPYTDFTLTGGEWQAWSKTVIVKDIAEWRSVTDIMNTWKIEGERLQTKKENFIVAINAILMSHRSLNKALKFWPPLRQYIPADVMERMEAKAKAEKPVAPPERSVPAYGVNLDTLNSTATLLKISK